MGYKLTGDMGYTSNWPDALEKCVLDSYHPVHVAADPQSRPHHPARRPEVLPKSALGKAIDYTLTLWPKLTLYVDQVHLEIDNNWIENGIRPTAIDKKNWLFIGGEATGQRSAIIYTLIECARRHGHNPEAYLADILERLPAMTNQDDLSVLLSSRWQPATATDAELEPALKA